MRKIPALVLILLGPALTDGGTRADDLSAAAKRGDLFAVEHYLRKFPESIEARDGSGYTALHWAGIRGKWEAFEALLAAGAPVNATGGDGGTPLHWACHHDRPDMVRLLLDRGADLSVQNRWGRTPLHVAARRGCDLVAALLIARGAEPDATTREGWTPLHVAYRAGHPRVVDLLLDSGASPELRDRDGKAPADGAFRRPEPISMESAELDPYVGRYALGPDASVKIWKEKGRLHLMEFAPDEIDPIGPDKFLCRREPWEVRFHRNDTGAVERIEIDFLRRTVSGNRLPDLEYVGSRRCGECHTGDDLGGQYVSWMRSAHGLAYWQLASDWAAFLASRRQEYSDIQEPEKEWRCLKCHVTGAQDLDSGFAATFRQEEGVGCESCHGPGSAYVDPEVMADRDLFLQNGGRIPGEATCRRCHEGDRFQYDERLPRIAHPRPEKIDHDG
jgi:hypothetical protein